MLATDARAGQELHTMLPRLEAWFAVQIMGLYAVARHRPDNPLLIGCPLWGGDYIDRFLTYCVPSLRAPENRAALMGAVLVILTDRASVPRLEEELTDLADDMDLFILVIPDEIMDQAKGHPLNRYWVLGTSQNLLLRMARRFRCGFHMLMPDHLYAERYFPNLLRLGADHPVIAQPGISATVADAAAAIEAYRTTHGALEIPDEAIGAIAWEHMHRQSRANLMTAHAFPHDMPAAHLLIYRARDKIIVHSVHANAAYLSPAVVRAAPTRIPATMDAEMPAFARGAYPYVPKAGDGLAFVELSDHTKGAHPNRVDFPEFARAVWTTINFDGAYLDYYRQPCEFPAPPDASPMAMTEPAIAAQVAEIMRLLEETEGTIASETLRDLANTWRDRR